jgi:hypothetical protein
MTTDTPSTSSEGVDAMVALLHKQAAEIASEGHNGWGNTMSQAAELIVRLAAEKVDAQRYREIRLWNPTKFEKAWIDAFNSYATLDSTVDFCRATKGAHLT